MSLPPAFSHHLRFIMSNASRCASYFSPSDVPSLSDLLDNNQEPETVIGFVREMANRMYSHEKERMQRSLYHRIAEAVRSDDPVRVRTAKKKVDNQASAVATRERRRIHVSFSEQLASESIRRLNNKNAEINNKNAEIRALKQEVKDLRERLEKGSSQPVNDQMVCPSASPSSQDHLMIPLDNAVFAVKPADTVGHQFSSMLSAEQLNTLRECWPLQSNDDQNFQPSIDCMTIDSVITNPFEEQVTPQIEECGSGGYKFDLNPVGAMFNDLLDADELTFLRARVKEERFKYTEAA